MKTLTFATALAVTIGAATASLADVRQLAASAGIDAAEAASMSLTEIVRIKYNAEHRGDDRTPIVTTSGVSGVGARSQLAAAAGVSPAWAEGMSLTELAVAKSFSESRGDDRQAYVVDGGPTKGGAGFMQLTSSLGISPDAARMMSMHEIYLAKIIRESGDN